MDRRELVDDALNRPEPTRTDPNRPLSTSSLSNPLSAELLQASLLVTNEWSQLVSYASILTATQ